MSSSAASPRRSSPSLFRAMEIFDLVRDDLVLVEHEIAAQSSAAIQPIVEISSHLHGGGGKRLRPALLLLAAGAAGYRGPAAIRLGAIVELIHSATLIHDDVIDEATTRRGRPSANARWGNHMSVLAGDWLYMQSFQMALGERSFEILDILINLTQNMVEGELLQLAHLGRIDVTEAECADLAYRKTACLFSGCARLGAVLGRLDKSAEESLADYGRYAGLAFQLVDDVLDFTSSFEQLGKPVLSDLKEGKVTLPLIYAMQIGAGKSVAVAAKAGAAITTGPAVPAGSPDGHATAHRLVATVLEERGFHTVRPEEIVRLVHDSGALDRARVLAHDYARRSKACLATWPDSPYRRALLAVPEFILEREN